MLGSHRKANCIVGRLREEERYEVYGVVLQTEARGPGIPRTSTAPAALTPAVPGGKEEALEDLYLQREHRC